MAAFSNNEDATVELEENVTCPVCLSRYDDGEKKPKYLVSCCHTVCRYCLFKMSQSGAFKTIPCPICRSLTMCPNGVDGLPTNSDKLYLLKLARQEKSDDEVLDWCFTCRKKTSPNCSKDQHSVIVMNPQLLNGEVHLNMATISAGLRTYGEATIRHRSEIAARLEKLSSWLASYQKMILAFQTANENRISQLNGMLQGTNLTVSIQKLMQLSINNEQNLGLLKDGEQEEALTHRLLQELRSVEQMAEACGTSRRNPFVTFPQVPTLRKEMNLDKYFPADGAQWPAIFLDVLTSVAPSPTPSFQFIATSPDQNRPRPQEGVSPVMFRFPPAITATPPGHSDHTNSVIRFGLGRGATRSLSPLAGRGIVTVVRRRR